MNPVMFRWMTESDAEAVSQLVIRVFDASIAPLYEAEGVQTFHAYASSGAVAQRATEDHFVVLAHSGGEVVGVMEVRDNSHLAMFFVSETFQRSGLGRELLSRVVATCLQFRPELETVTVHASPNSLGAYERLGFVATGPEQTVSGIRSTPMALHLEPDELQE